MGFKYVSALMIYLDIVNTSQTSLVCHTAPKMYGGLGTLTKAMLDFGANIERGMGDEGWG